MTTIDKVEISKDKHQAIFRFTKDGEEINWFVKGDKLLELLESTFQGQITK